MSAPDPSAAVAGPLLPAGSSCAEPATTESAPAAGADAQAIVPQAATLLDGSEIVEFTLKPSLWYIAIASFKFVLITVLAAAAYWAAAQNDWAPRTWLGVQAILLVGGVRLGFAALQWASRVYLLTNRRVVRLRGVFRVEVSECRLADVSRVTLHVAWYQRVLRLGTLRVASRVADAIPVAWEQIARAPEIHERVLRAIRRVQG